MPTAQFPYLSPHWDFDVLICFPLSRGLVLCLHGVTGDMRNTNVFAMFWNLGVWFFLHCSGRQKVNKASFKTSHIKLPHMCLYYTGAGSDIQKALQKEKNELDTENNWFVWPFWHFKLGVKIVYRALVTPELKFKSNVWKHWNLRASLAMEGWPWLGKKTTGQWII